MTGLRSSLFAIRRDCGLVLWRTSFFFSFFGTVLQRSSCRRVVDASRSRGASNSAFWQMLQPPDQPVKSSLRVLHGVISACMPSVQ